jgi:hypothetical protein
MRRDTGVATNWIFMHTTAHRISGWLKQRPSDPSLALTADGLNQFCKKRHFVRATIFCVIAMLYLALPNARPDFSRFNAHDSESYLALSHSLVHGRGYTRNMIEQAYIPHTTWPPGLPVLMMPAVAVGGQIMNWVAVKCLTASIGLIGVLIIWFYVRRCFDIVTADISALVIALNPYYWHFSHMAMTEVPVLVWLTGSLLLIDVVWASKIPSHQQAFAVGVLLGAGMLLKGVVCGLMLVPGAYLLRDRSRNRLWFKHALVWVTFCVGFFVCTLAWAIRNRTIETSDLGFDGINQFRMLLTVDPIDPLSPIRTLAQLAGSIVANVKYGAIYNIPQQIIPGLWAPFFERLPFLALTLTLVLSYFCIPRRPAAWPITITVLPIAVLYLIYASGNAGRYWVPITQFLTILLVNRAVGVWSLRATPRMRGLLFTLLISILAVNVGSYIVVHEQEPYSKANNVSELARLFSLAAKLEFHPKGVFTDHPHAFALITGHAAPMSLPSRGINPRYSHAIIRRDNPASRWAENSRTLLSVYPWELIELKTPMYYGELTTPPILSTAADPGGKPGIIEQAVE